MENLIPINLLEKQLQETTEFASGKLLDVGCGNKPFSHLFHQKVERIFGLDSLTTMKCDLERGIDVCGNLLDLPYKSNVFDTILCLRVLEHIPDPLRAFSEMYRVLKNGGHLILSTLQTYELHGDPYDFYRYTQYGLQYIAETNGFHVVYVKQRGGLGAFTTYFITRIIALVLIAIDGFLSKIIQKLHPCKRNNIIFNPLTKILIAFPQKVYSYLVSRRRLLPKYLQMYLDKQGKLFTLGHTTVCRK